MLPLLLTKLPKAITTTRLSWLNEGVVATFHSYGFRVRKLRVENKALVRLMSSITDIPAKV